KRPFDVLEQLYLRVLTKKKLVYDAVETDEVYLSLKELAQFYREHQKYQKVVPVYIEVLALLEQAQQKHPEVKTDETFVEYLVDDMADLGDAYGKLPKPDYAEAEKYYAQALALEKVRPSLSTAEQDEA